MNTEFQTLKMRYLREHGEEKENLLSQLRENLKQRNGNESLYSFRYTYQGKTIDIDECDEHELFEIDGDIVNFEK